MAILDGAIYSAHRDLDDNLDMAASASFVPGVAWNQDTGTFWHGTHVAGIVAAEANGIGTVGIAPEATLIGVKVLHSGSGAFQWITNGIMYAATPTSEGGAGANIINMSLGAEIPSTHGDVDPALKAAIRELKKSVDRATKYAYKRGVTVISSAGNGGSNFDIEKNLLKIPAENDYVISVSATGPINWARGGTNYSDRAYYSDYGKSLVDVSAPGGTYGLAIINGDFSSCTLYGITTLCTFFDAVFSTVRGGPTSTASYNWAQGTSMAAPAAAGVAALIVGKNGGPMHPSMVETALRRSATDEGKAGQDEVHGHGWVSAARAVGAR